MNTLAEITTADRDSLSKRWELLFEHEPPPQIHTALMRRVVAWNVQMQQAGLDPSAGRSPTVRPPVTLKPGTRLLREWQAAYLDPTQLSEDVCQYTQFLDWRSELEADENAIADKVLLLG